MLPQLKQKTGIVKSKVPPPVPPRGSPKERRGGNQQQHQHLGSSNSNHRYKMSSSEVHSSSAVRDDRNAGSQNVNSSSNLCLRPSIAVVVAHDKEDPIDYYTPDGVEIVPKFGERRSPSCVDDWLELNHMHNAKTANSEHIRIKTKCLQKEFSFPSGKPLNTVPSMIQSFSTPSIRPNSIECAGTVLPSRFTNPNQNCLELENLRKASSVSKLLATTFKDETHKTVNNDLSSRHKNTIIKRNTKRRAPCPDQIAQRCT